MSVRTLIIALAGAGLGGLSLFLQLQPKPSLLVRTPIVKQFQVLSYRIQGFTPNARFISGFAGLGNLQGVLDGSGSAEIAFAVADAPNQSYTLYAQDGTGKFATAQVWVQPAV